MTSSVEGGKNEGVYIHHVSRGYKRLFFQVSVPLTWLDIPKERIEADPREVEREIAAKVEKALMLEALS